MSIDARISRLGEWIDAGYGHPYMVELRLTERCNLRCRFCHQAVRNSVCEVELNLKQLLEAVREAAELGVEEWVIAGDGEPMCRLEDCLAVMKAIKERGMTGSILTNGTLLTADAIKEIVGMGWDRVMISLDGPGAEIHDYLRVMPGVFARVMGAIDRINSMKAERSAQSPLLDFQMVMTSRNYGGLKDMIRLAAEKGVKRVTFQPLIYHDGADRSLVLSDLQLEGLKASIPKVLREAERLDIDTNLGAYLDMPLIENTDSMQNVLVSEAEKGEHPLFGYPCYEPWYFIEIRPDGYVSPCWHVRGDIMSNLKNAPLKELWTGQYFTRFRRRIADRKMFKECEKCCAVGVITNQKIRGRLRNSLHAIKSRGHKDEDT